VIPKFSLGETACEEVIGDGGDVGVCVVVPFLAGEVVGVVFVVATELLVLDAPAEEVWLDVALLLRTQHCISLPPPGQNPATLVPSQRDVEIQVPLPVCRVP
jgi:hypothetical protein